MKHIYWVGIKESEINACRHLFQGSITFIGSGKDGNISYSANTDYIINYNEDSDELDNFMKKSLLSIINKVPDVSFLCYTTSYIYSLEEPEINKHIICGNNRDTLQVLRNKMSSRLWLNKFVPVLPTIILSGSECVYTNLCNHFPEESSFTIQGCTGAGGIDTYIMTCKNHRNIQDRLYKNHIYLISPYKSKSYSTNIHIFFYDNTYYLTPGSIQIVEKHNGRMIYKGSDFIEYQNIPLKILKKIQELTHKIAQKIQLLSYKGILGVDFLIANSEVYFLEINPRFQSSTPLINFALKEKGLPTIQELLLKSFYENEQISKDIFCDLKVKHSSYIIDYEDNQYDYKSYLDNIKNSNEIEDVVLDGYYPNMRCEPGASIFSVTFDKNIISLNPDGNYNLYDNIKVFRRKKVDLNSRDDSMWLKTSMMNQGVHFSKNAYTVLCSFQKGVYSSLDIYITNDFIINTPIGLCFHSLSPFKIECLQNNNLALYYGQEFITYVNIQKKNNYCDQYTKSGVNFQHISFIATDRLRIHHSPNCIFQTRKQGCRFCDVSGDSFVYDENDIREVIDWHVKHSKFRHILIGGASGDYPQEHFRILKIIKYIKSKTSKPIYLMTLPPKDNSVLEQYYSAGVDEVAFNIEIFDRSIAAKIMPGKGAIALETYKNALLYSVKLWGKTGNVRSLLVYGLEKDATFFARIEWLASNGVQPIISPFRPLRGTMLSNIVPPSTENLIKTYHKASSICNKYDLNLGPDCVYCQNNTLSFSAHLIFS